MGSDSVLVAALAVSRNDATAPFPHAAEERTLVELLGRVGDTLTQVAGSGEWELFDMDAIPPVQRAYLVERGLWSEFVGPRECYLDLESDPRH